MTTAVIEPPQTKSTELLLATFYVGDVLAGLDISNVQEVIRLIDTTPVPDAPEFVPGVMNLRGDVVTVIDLRRVLGLAPAEITPDSRNLVVQNNGELIGLRVDRIADILTIDVNDLSSPPTNVAGVDGRFIDGVYTTQSDIVVVLNLKEILAA
jgi:purine-binding chemotaxis protein CheW